MRLRAILSVLPLACAVCLLAASGASASACTINWDPATSGSSWSTASNWVENRVPDAEDAVCIPATAGTAQIYIDSDSTVASIDADRPVTVWNTLSIEGAEPSSFSTLTISGGSLLGSADISVSDYFRWIFGTIGGSGRFTVEEGATGRLASNHFSELMMLSGHRAFENKGTLDWLGSLISAPDSDPELVNSGTIHASGGNMALSAGSTAKFHNSGELAGSYTTLGWLTDNDGTIRAEAGSVALTNGDEGATSTGTFESSISASIALAGGVFNLAGGPQLQGDVTTYLPAEIRLLGDESSIGTLLVTNGHVSGPGNLAIAGRLEVTNGASIDTSGDVSIVSGASLFWSSGSIAGSGRLTISSGATAEFSSVIWERPTLGGTRVLANYGTMRANGSYFDLVGNESSIENYGQFELLRSGRISAPGNGQARLKNFGSIVEMGEGHFINATIQNDGLVEAETGPVFIDGFVRSVSHAGIFRGDSSFASINIQSGVFSIGPETKFEGSVNTDTLKVVVDGDASVGGNWRSIGTTLDIGGRLTFTSDFEFLYGTRTGDGEARVANGATFNWRGGNLGGDGLTSIAPGGHMSIDHFATQELMRLTGTHTIDNRGLMTWTQGMITAGPNAQVVNRSEMSVGQNSGYSVGFNGPAEVENFGTLSVTAGTIPLGGTLTNAGSLEVQNASLDVNDYRATRDSLTRIWTGQNPDGFRKRLDVWNLARVQGDLEILDGPAGPPRIGQPISIMYTQAVDGRFDSVNYEPGGFDFAQQFGGSVFSVVPATAEFGFAGRFGTFSAAGDGGDGGSSDSPLGFGAEDRPLVDSLELKPLLSLAASPEDDTVLPAQHTTISSTVKNVGADLKFSGSFRAPILKRSSEVTSAIAFIETRESASSSWSPLLGTNITLAGHTPEFVPPTDTGLQLTATLRSDPGVTASTGADDITGIVVSPNTTAVWDYEGTSGLTAAQSAAISNAQDARLVVRTESKFDLPGCPDPQLRGTNQVADLHDWTAGKGAVKDASIEVTRPNSSPVVIDSSGEPGLASLSPGEETTIATEFIPDPIAARSEAETQEQYLTRLRGEDGREFRVDVRADGGYAVAGSTNPENVEPRFDSAHLSQILPILDVDKSGPTSVNAGETAVYDIAVNNSGSSSAEPVLEDTVGSDQQSISDPPGTLATGASSLSKANVQMPSEAQEVTDKATVRWSDGEGNSYGPIADSFTTSVVGQNLNTPEASPIDNTQPTESFSDETSFLYEGDNAIQKDVDQAQINPKRVGIVRGSVKDVSGQALAGVKVSIIGHPEYGYTYSRDDGNFYIAVNGGGTLMVNFEKVGYMVSQRRVEPDWNDYTFIDADVALVKLDENVAEINLDGDAADSQVARGSIETDNDGSRRSTLIFAPGTKADMLMKNGDRIPLPVGHVRASEITVGPNGKDAMPGDLPPSSAYTYAVAFSADEAIALGAEHVEFDKPVANYVENFLKFPVGEVVPNGYQDPERNIWIPTESGRVIKLLAETAGVAIVDIEGHGTVATASQLEELGISEDELREVARLYEPGETLWRVPIHHFSNHAFSAINPADFVPVSTIKFDLNWAVRFLADGGPEKGGGFEDNGTGGCGGAGGWSIITCEPQALDEEIPLEGVADELHYSTRKMPGYVPSRSVTVPLTANEPLSSDLARIDAVVSVAGRKEVFSFAPGPNKKFSYTWDGKDVFGRTVSGSRDIDIRIGFQYNAHYGPTPSFSQPSAPVQPRPGVNSDGYYQTLDFARQQLGVWATHHLTVGQYESPSTNIAGWSLDSHHFYDPATERLFRGDGESSTASPTKVRSLEVFAGTGVAGVSADGASRMLSRFNSPSGIAFLPDGSLVVADTSNNQVRKIDPDGSVSIVAGTGVYGFSGDGNAATNAKLASPSAVAVDLAGSVYIADTNNHRVRRVSPSGTITTIAGGVPSTSDLGDDHAATDANLSLPSGVAVASWGDIYIADKGNNRLRRVTPDGIIHTLAGTGDPGKRGDGGLAIRAELNEPTGVYVDSDGNVYIADTRNNRIRVVSPTGSIRTVAGGGTDTGDNRPATDARLSLPTSVVEAPDGDLFIAERGSSRIRHVTSDGYVVTAAKSSSPVKRGPGSGAQAGVDAPTGVGISPDGMVYLADSGNNRLLRFATLGNGDAAGNIFVPSPSGETYEFSARGRHLKTLNSDNGATIRSFEYDDDGQLTAMIEADGNRTEIEYDADKNPSAIVGPYGQRTALQVNGIGFLTKTTSPSGAENAVTYQDGGLLKTFTDPVGKVSTMTYDDQGRLVNDENNGGSHISLSRTEHGDGFTVDATTALGRTSKFSVSKSGDSQERTTEYPDGTKQVLQNFSDGHSEATARNGVVSSTQRSPDSVQGNATPVIASQSATLPSGRTLSETTTESASLADPDDPFSLTGRTRTQTVSGRTSKVQYERLIPTGEIAGLNQPSGLMRFTSPENRSSEVVSDSLGRALHISRPAGASTDFTYDSRGRVDSVQFGNRAVQFRYDALGRLGAVRDPLGHESQYSYDAQGNTTGIELPDGREIAMTYDAMGNMVSLTPPSRQSHTISYTLLGLIESQSAPVGGSSTAETRFAYNADRDLSRITKPDGQVTEFHYDSAGRLASTESPDGASHASYDPETEQVSELETEEHQKLHFGFDGPLQTEQTYEGAVNGEVEMHYDDAAQLDAITTPQGSDHFEYDLDGLLKKAGGLTLDRDASTGRISGTSLASITTTRTLNMFGETTHESVTFPNGRFEEAVDRDQAGRAISRDVGPIGEQTHFEYEYDVSGRLLQVRRNNLDWRDYTYDANSNRTSVTRDGSTVTSAEFDGEDRMAAQGGVTLSYNQNGEMTEKHKAVPSESLNLAYRSNGELATASIGGHEVKYSYDALGNRTQRTVDDVVSQAFLYAPGMSGPVAQVGGGGGTKRFIYATRTNVPDYMVDGATTYRIVTDQIGSVVLVVNAETGAIAQQIEYDPFGVVLSDTNPGFQPFGFAGGLYDRDTHLTQFGARSYDPELGRWTSPDPAGFAGGDPNLYGYVIQDPINFTDPVGLKRDTGSIAEDDLNPGPRWMPTAPKKHTQPGTGELCLTLGGHAVVGGSVGVCWLDSPTGGGLTFDWAYGMGIDGNLSLSASGSNSKCLADSLGKSLSGGGGAGSVGGSVKVDPKSGLAPEVSGGGSLGPRVGGSVDVHHTSRIIGDFSKCKC